MAIEQSVEDLAESMRDHPESYAEMFLEQKALIEELNRKLGAALLQYKGVKH